MNHLITTKSFKIVLFKVSQQLLITWLRLYLLLLFSEMVIVAALEENDVKTDEYSYTCSICFIAHMPLTHYSHFIKS